MAKNTTRSRVGLLVRLEAKPGKEADLYTFLEQALPLVDAEPKTSTWYAIQLAPGTFGIFDTFPDSEGREDHLGGKVAAALMSKAGELLSKPPVIEKLDVIAVKPH